MRKGAFGDYNRKILTVIIKSSYKYNVKTMKRILSILNLLLLTYVLSAQGVRYTTANLNLRLMPTTSARVITVIPKGTPVALDDDCDCKWIPVSYNGLVGYVSSSYLSKVKPTYSTSSNSTVEYSQASSNYTYPQKSANHPIGRVRYYTNSRYNLQLITKGLQMVQQLCAGMALIVSVEVVEVLARGMEV